MTILAGQSMAGLSPAGFRCARQGVAKPGNARGTTTLVVPFSDRFFYGIALPSVARRSKARRGMARQGFAKQGPFGAVGRRMGRFRGVAWLAPAKRSVARRSSARPGPAWQSDANQGERPSGRSSFESILRRFAKLGGARLSVAKRRRAPRGPSGIDSIVERNVARPGAASPGLAWRSVVELGGHTKGRAVKAAPSSNRFRRFRTVRHCAVRQSAATHGGAGHRTPRALRRIGLEMERSWAWRSSAWRCPARLRTARQSYPERSSATQGTFGSHGELDD